MGGVRGYAPSHFLSANTGLSMRSLFRATAFIRKKLLIVAPINPNLHFNFISVIQCVQAFMTLEVPYGQFIVFKIGFHISS